MPMAQFGFNSVQKWHSLDSIVRVCSVEFMLIEQTCSAYIYLSKLLIQLIAYCSTSS